MSGTITMTGEEYDALHAEAEAMRVALLGIASVNPAERGIEWAKSYASDGLKGAGSELYARWLDTFKEAEALRAENGRLSQQLAQSDAALRESRANDMANVRTLENMWERHDALRQELEAARGLLRDAKELIEHGDFDTGICCCGSSVAGHGIGDGHSPVDEGGYYAGGISERIDAFLTATPAPEVQAEQGERQEAAAEPNWIQDISMGSLEWMESLGSFGPTALAERREIKGYTADKDGDLVKTYYDSGELRGLAVACVEVADWLDRRAHRQAQRQGDSHD